MTVKEMLQLPELEELTVVAGEEGLTNKVTSVSVMDAPDIYNWMRGNEFLITTAYVYKEDVAGLTTLIHRLAQSGVSAFGIKSHRFMGTLPAEVINAANLERLPLIHIPNRFPFTEIILPVMQRVVEKNTENLKMRDKIHSLFIHLAISNSRISETLVHLEDLLQKPVAFWDTCFDGLYLSSQGSPFSAKIRGMFERGEMASLESDESIHSYPVANLDTSYGRILYEGHGPDVSEYVVKTALEYASVVMIIRMQSRLSTVAVEEKYKDQLLADLLYNNIKSDEEIESRAKLYGWDFSSGGVAVVVDINNYKRAYLREFDSNKANLHNSYVDEMFDTAIDILSARFQSVKHYKQSDYITFLLSVDKRERPRLREDLEEAFQAITGSFDAKIPFTSTMGVGIYRDKIRDISKSFEEARSTINIGYQSDLFDCILFYEDLGIARLLQNVKSTGEAMEYVDKYILPLVEYEESYHVALFETLQAIIHSGWKLKLAAGKLHVHYNSVKYRFSKISELLGVDLHQHYHQFNVEIALQIYQLNRKAYKKPLPAGERTTVKN